MPPGYAFAAPGANPPAPGSTTPVESAPRQSRGCATAAILALAAVALVLLVAGVWAIVALTGVGGGDYGAAPDCSVADTATLDGLVPEHETELDQPLGLKETWRDGHECRWGTAADAAAVPAAARLVLVRSDDHTGGEGEQEAADALEAAAQEHGPKAVEDLGDEALSWSETSRNFTWGCVGVRMSNLYTLSCYTASIDFQASDAIPEEEAIAGAEELARTTIARIEESGF